MRVDPGLLATLAAAASPQRRGGPRPAFTPSEGPARSSGPSAAAPLATLDALLAVQNEANEPGERRRRSLKRGHELLAALDSLKAGLLGGRVSARELRGLAGQLADRGELSGDPGLDDIVAQIELRAEVELAKIARV